MGKYSTLSVPLTLPNTPWFFCRRNRSFPSLTSITQIFRTDPFIVYFITITSSTQFEWLGFSRSFESLFKWKDFFIHFSHSLFYSSHGKYNTLVVLLYLHCFHYGLTEPHVFLHWIWDCHIFGWTLSVSIAAGWICSELKEQPVSSFPCKFPYPVDKWSFQFYTNYLFWSVVFKVVLSILYEHI